jgi:hypothetical protein
LRAVSFQHIPTHTGCGLNPSKPQRPDPKKGTLSHSQRMSQHAGDGPHIS